MIDNSTTKNVSEFLNSAYILVTLATIPSSNVILPVSSDNTTQGTVSPAALVITPSNWNTPNTVTVTGVDDDINDGTSFFNIKFANSISTDSKYDNVTPDKPSVPMKNIDDGNDY